MTIESTRLPAGLTKTQPLFSRWLIPVLFVAGLLIFAHGCHADEDRELSVLFDPQTKTPAEAAPRADR